MSEESKKNNNPNNNQDNPKNASYDAKEVEAKIAKFWETEKIYKFDSKRKGKVYSIDTPPPTVSGAMHIGHAFSYSQQDFIARFWRMKENVFYPFGTDDNGLPTERLVEKINNVKSKEMSRTKFIELCLKTLKEITPEFIQSWKNLGISCDYNISYSTIDKNSQKISQQSFIELYNKGQIYRKEFPTLWCPECQTAIAQAELEDKEIASKFTTLKFTLSVNGKNEVLPIATTRPELLGACVAVFVHPQDKRYKKFVGKKARVPLFEHEVPIIEDESAEIEKGTGALMICSYGDKYDVDAIKRHKLISRIVFTSDGRIKDGKYKGLRIFEARKQILADLAKENFIVGQKEIGHNVNVHDKCGTPIEFIETDQWFIKILDKKKKLIEQGKKIRWHPKFMFKRYENWIKGLEWDWTISRDRHFGVPIPVWYCNKCKEMIVANEKELPIDPLQIKKQCPKCKSETVAETKVLDTWATSSLTPQIASALIDNKINIPFSLRPQAHDLIRTWAFYTITKSYLHENKIPWQNIMISGFVTLGKEKMSKSKGNVISPHEVIDKFGSDALRFWTSGSKLGEDTDYQESDLIAGKKFLTKLWNASNFVFMNLKDYDFRRPRTLVLTDDLFLKELNSLIKKVTISFETYEYSKAKQDIEKFFWNVFCDNYLEIVKWRIYNGNKQEKESAQYTLYRSLITILKLIAPIIPFVTEEIYQEYYKKDEGVKSIHLCEWPRSVNAKLMNFSSRDNSFAILMNIISKIRQKKSEAKKSVKAEIILYLDKGMLKRLPKQILEDLKHVSNSKEIREGKFKVEFVE